MQATTQKSLAGSFSLESHHPSGKRALAMASSNSGKMAPPARPEQGKVRVQVSSMAPCHQLLIHIEIMGQLTFLNYM